MEKLSPLSFIFRHGNNISLILKIHLLKEVALNTCFKHQLGIRYLSLLGPAALTLFFE